MDKNKELLIEVYKDTTTRILNGFYSNKLEFEKVNLFEVKYNKSTSSLDNISVVNIDCIMAIQSNDNNCILNMASYKKPGGGVKNGSMAQEEELARRSNLMFGLDNNLYPLKMEEFIYTKNVTFFKDTNYDIMDPKISDVITIPAINLREYSDITNEDYHRITRKKIFNILTYPHKMGVENIILGAFGCGVFKNDPSYISLIFREFLETGISKLYKNITFPILNDANSFSNNYEIFKNNLNP